MSELVTPGFRNLNHLQANPEFQLETEALERFREVRDMPFDVATFGGGKKYADVIDDIKNRGRGGCSAKHYLLGYRYEQIGIKPIYFTTPFRWLDLDVNYPENVRKLAAEMPIQYHLSLVVDINGSLCLLDATWDPPLIKADFPVNINYDSFKDTELAVVPCGKSICHNSGHDRWLYIQSIKSEMPWTGKEPEFYNTLNNWLESLRRSD